MITQKYEVTEVPVKLILRDDNFNCRGEITPESVQTLMEDIKLRGLDSPITVIPYKDPVYKYKIVAGHRRYTACRLLGMQTIPCYVREDLDPIKAAIYNIKENLERKNLNILQEANGIRGLASLGYNSRQIGKAIGEATRWVNIRINLLRLPKSVQEDAAAGLILPTEIELLAAMLDSGKNEDDILKAANTARDRRLTVSSISKKLLSQMNRNAEKSIVKLRPKEEIEDIMQFCIHSLRGPSLASWALAWTLGTVTTKNFLEQVGKEAELYGYNFVVPQMYVYNEEKEKEQYRIINADDTQN